MAGLLVVAVITAVTAVRFGRDADQQRTLILDQNAQILSRHAAAYSDSESVADDPALSARLAAAWAISKTDEASASMASLLSRPQRATLTGHTGWVNSVAFSPDGTRLASGDDGTVRIWDVALPQDLLGAVCAIAGRGFTPEEWRQYIRDAPYQPTCPASR
ncbi:WD40 repeat domain-containing protein [Streptosporangium sp. NPDC049376]|uniref:WD40 repeat domain-containing protein n=1 Tax=Streptosporangium sp. NPDC049376 TaxID=3366192 RepID=UPI00379D4019